MSQPPASAFNGLNSRMRCIVAKTLPPLSGHHKPFSMATKSDGPFHRPPGRRFAQTPLKYYPDRKAGLFCRPLIIEAL